MRCGPVGTVPTRARRESRRGRGQLNVTAQSSNRLVASLGETPPSFESASNMSLGEGGELALKLTLSGRAPLVNHSDALARTESLAGGK
jgi:hypothetical protein